MKDSIPCERLCSPDNRAERETEPWLMGLSEVEKAAWWAVQAWLSANPDRSEQEAVTATRVDWGAYQAAHRKAVATDKEAFKSWSKPYLTARQKDRMCKAGSPSIGRRRKGA